MDPVTGLRPFLEWRSLRLKHSKRRIVIGNLAFSGLISGKSQWPIIFLKIAKWAYTISDISDFNLEDWYRELSYLIT
jgi:hypothetical protein